MMTLAIAAAWCAFCVFAYYHRPTHRVFATISAWMILIILLPTAMRHARKHSRKLTDQS